MKRTRKHIEQILDQSLGQHRSPSRSEIDSVVNRVWESLPAEDRVELRVPIEVYTSRPKLRPWRLAVAAGVLLVFSLTFLRRSPQTNELPPLPPIDVATGANADALFMEAISAHISRTIPAPMEPIMTLIPPQPGETE
jgi:hypothetical protein